MKFARDHTHNRRRYKKGERYEGDVNTGRFLYHRGVLEPDGAEHDAAITSKRPQKQAWHSGDEAETKSAPEQGEKAEE